MRVCNVFVLGSLCVLASACSNDGGVNRTPNEPPVAEAGDNRTVGTDIQVSFDGSASSDPDGTIATYTWDFGDGTATATGAQVDHVFTSDGVYTVTLTVEDDDGATDQDNPTVTSEVLVVDGTYAVAASPNSQPCGLAGNVTFVATNVVMTATNGGATLNSDWGLDEEPGVTTVPAGGNGGTGSLSGADFVQNWTYLAAVTDTTGVFELLCGVPTITTTYANGWIGAFVGDGTFTSNLHQNITDDCGLAACDVDWNVGGTKIAN